MLKKTIIAISFIICFGAVQSQNKTVSRNRLFDEGWRFIKDTTEAYANDYDDTRWRTVNLPHDWSIEDLPNQNDVSIQGPFSKSDLGKAATGFTVGGTGWYRRKFVTSATEQNKLVSIHFDGVYMNADVWLNGHLLGTHPYGYTPFYYDLTPFLLPAGKENVLAVRVRNEGKNSRWYSGSGIYRHVWLTVTNPIHIEPWGIYITASGVSAGSATLQIHAAIGKKSFALKGISLLTTIIAPGGQVAGQTKKEIKAGAEEILTDSQNITVKDPVLWTLEKPRLYKAVTEIKVENKTVDKVETSFGIRSIQMNAATGLTLNGKKILLKGGCIHHDNGPLGAAAFDRAEERKIELLKKAGYNAIRISHNPPSTALLDACDQLGMLVLDEAFDMWVNAKNAQDYHLYFKEWWQKDLQSMILRDRNHPSVFMWSIGNEIYEAPDSVGHALSKQLTAFVHQIDPTRPVTAATVFLPPYTKKTWEEYEPYQANLDVDGYNYFLDSNNVYFNRDSATVTRFDSEHAKHPQKLFMVTEYLASASLANWDKAVNNAFLLGGFKWTAMDYIGEAGIGRSLIVPAAKKLPKGLMGMGLFYKDSWPVFNAYCGDLDLIGNRKAASYYQAVVWRNSPVELLVHRPIPDSMKEVIATWGFPDELKSWSWPGHEHQLTHVDVYTRSREVRLELNGKLVATQMVPEGSITASFDIPYEPGTLVARSFNNGKETGSSSLSTTGKPVAVRLVADRTSIKADLNDLSYVSVEIVDGKGNIVPYADDLEINYTLTGSATIAAVGNGNVDDMSSFQQAHKKVYQGRGLVIIRSDKTPGKIILTATAANLSSAVLTVVAK